MSQENQITLRGYVTAEPKFFQTTQSGTLGAEVRLGSTPRWLNRTTGEWQEGDPTYYTVKCWRKLAVNVRASLHKGDRVLVRGKFVTRTWVDDQQHQRVQVEIEADSIGHDLVFGWSIFNRIQTPRNVPQQLADGEMARAGLDGPDGAESVGVQTADGLPAVGRDPESYLQDDYSPGGPGDPFPAGDASGFRDLDDYPDTSRTPAAESATVAAEAVPF